MDSAVIVALVGSAGVLFGAVTSGMFQRRKISADAASAIAEAASTMLTPLTERVKALEDERAGLIRDLSALRCDMDDMKRKVAMRNQRINGLEVELRRKETRIGELESRVKELECEVEKLRDENSRLKGDG